MAGYKYFWQCPDCGTEIQVRQRVTQTKRKCPHCGTLVTPQGVDRTTAKKKREIERGGEIFFGIIAIIFAVLLAVTKCG